MTHRPEIRALGKCVWLLAAVYAPACADDATSGSEPLGTSDGGQHMDEIDASANDAGTSDAGSDASLAVDAGLASECRGDVLSFPSARVRSRSFSASAAQNRLELALFQPTCGGTSAENSAQGLELHTLGTTGEPQEAKALVNLGVESCAMTAEPAILARADGSYSLFFTSNFEDHYDLYYLDGAASPVRMTNDALRGEGALSAALMGSQPFVAYSRESASASANEAAEIVTARPGYVSKVVVPESAGYHAVRTALAPLAGGDSSRAGVLAWVSDEPTHVGAFLQVVDAQGAAAGDVAALTTQTCEGVSLAQGKEGGAVAYSIAIESSQQARLRVINVDGSLGEEVALTENNESVRDVALAPYSTGYVLAYRRLGAGQEDSIRLMFLDAHGRVGRTRFVAEAAGGNGLQVLVAQDGRLWVLWEETQLVSATLDGGTAQIEGRIRVARVTCP